MFMLHGNTRDLCRWEGERGSPEYLALVPFLVEMFSRSKDIVLTYNVSQGIQFPDKQMEKRCLVAVNARRAIEGELPLETFPASPVHVLPLIERLITDRSQRVAVVLDFFETIVPMSDLSYMGDADKANLVAMQRWASDPVLGKGYHASALVTVTSMPGLNVLVTLGIRPYARCHPERRYSSGAPLRAHSTTTQRTTASRGRGGSGSPAPEPR